MRLAGKYRCVSAETSLIGLGIRFVFAETHPYNKTKPAVLPATRELDGQVENIVTWIPHELIFNTRLLEPGKIDETTSMCLLHTYIYGWYSPHTLSSVLFLIMVDIVIVFGLCQSWSCLYVIYHRTWDSLQKEHTCRLKQVLQAPSRINPSIKTN